MNRDQLLKKVIKKLYGRTVQVDFDTEGISITEKLSKDGFHNWCIDYADNGYYGIIFSHDFAKAFWGEDKICIGGSSGVCAFQSEHEALKNINPHPHPTIIAWKWHLQQMVMCAEPLEYIAKFL